MSSMWPKYSFDQLRSVGAGEPMRMAMSFMSFVFTVAFQALMVPPQEQLLCCSEWSGSLKSRAWVLVSSPLMVESEGQ